jgi:hypothetical protein
MTLRDNAAPEHRYALLAIFSVWSLWLCVLGGLGWLGQGTGLMVWPMGEDRNWIDLLMRDTASATARGFWAIDHRNPLSPWWYIAFKPLIMGWPQGLYLLRQIVSLALAFSTYALIVTWLGAGARRFAATVGCLIVVFTANAFFDQIYWNFHVALISSILCVTCFLRHRSSPGNGQWLAASLVLWLVAIATYTIQTGAIVAIAFAAWSLRERMPENPSSLNGWQHGLRDIAQAVWPFAAILVLFILIWQTTSVPAEKFIGGASLGRLLQSLASGVWHEDSPLMRDVLALSAHRHVYWLVAALVFLAVLTFARAPGLAASRLGGLLALAGCLAAPTLFVETAGTQWPPGSRWRMIYQFTTPLFYLTALGMMVWYLPAGIARWAWRSALAACFSLAVLASLAHNERQVVLTTSERNLRYAIIQDAVSRPSPDPLTYLVLLGDDARWFSLDVLTPVYARTWFPSGNLNFRLIPSLGRYAGLQHGARVTFMEDGKGVANATIDGETIPYERIRLVRAEGLNYAVINRLAAGDLAGLRAEWQRTAPLILAPCVPATTLCR